MRHPVRDYHEYRSSCCIVHLSLVIIIRLIFTSERFLFCKKFQKWFFFSSEKGSTKCSKQYSIASLKFRICSYLKVLIGNNMGLVFLKIFAIKKSHAGKDGPRAWKRKQITLHTDLWIMYKCWWKNVFFRWRLYWRESMLVSAGSELRDSGSYRIQVHFVSLTFWTKILGHIEIWNEYLVRNDCAKI